MHRTNTHIHTTYNNNNIHYGRCRVDSTGWHLINDRAFALSFHYIHVQIQCKLAALRTLNASSLTVTQRSRRHTRESRAWRQANIGSGLCEDPRW